MQTPCCRILAVVGLALLSPLARAATADTPAAAPAVVREIIPLDEGWRFQLGDEPRAAQPVFDDTAWRTLDVPHDWSIEGVFSTPPAGENNGGYFPHGIGWYRKTFALAADASRKVVVEFDGVYMNSEVWINGRFLGRRPYGYIGFRYDLTEFLKTDGTPNVLAVRVDDSLEPSVRWYAGAGIYRHVRLVTTGYTHFRLDCGVAVTTPEVTPDRATVEAAYVVDAHFFSEEERQAWLKNIWNAKSTTRELVLRSAVLAPDGTVVADSESKLALESLYAGQRTSQRLTVPAPRLWSDRTPELYRLRSTLSLGERTLDEVTTQFGIRQLEFHPDRGLLVNGTPTKLKGVCIHQDGGSFGNAVPVEVWAWRLSRLKEMGCNALRLSHHPFAPEFYDLCDRLGFYVLDEAFDEWTRGWPYNFTADPRGKSQYGYHLYFEQWAETDLRAMLRRDRNHPSVVLYSIGNEIPNEMDHDGGPLARKLTAICHEEDPTRPVTAGCDKSDVANENGFMAALDIAGYNYVDRIHGDRTYEPERARFPRRLCLGTETYYPVRNWLGVRNNDYVIGEFLWAGFDYLGESQKYPRRGWDAGLLDLAGGAYPEFYQRAAYWRTDPVVRLAVLTGEKPEDDWHATPALTKWNWPAAATLTVRVATNCDEVELILNKRTFGRHAVPRDTCVSEWSVPFAPGAITAVGYRAGQRVAEHTLRTAGAPVGLTATALVTPVPGDVALCEILVVDAAGIAVPDASAAVTVRVEGPGRLIGLDTGDLAYGGLFKTDSRAAHQGRLLAAVRRMSPAGEIHVLATSDGLQPATLALPVGAGEISR